MCFLFLIEWFDSTTTKNVLSTQLQLNVGLNKCIVYMQLCSIFIPGWKNVVFPVSSLWHVELHNASKYLVPAKSIYWILITKMTVYIHTAGWRLNAIPAHIDKKSLCRLCKTLHWEDSGWHGYKRQMWRKCVFYHN